MQTMDMLSKFKSRLRVARYKPGDSNEETHDSDVTNADKNEDKLTDEW